MHLALLLSCTAAFTVLRGRQQSSQDPQTATVTNGGLTLENGTVLPLAEPAPLQGLLNSTKGTQTPFNVNNTNISMSNGTVNISVNGSAELTCDDKWALLQEDEKKYAVDRRDAEILGFNLAHARNHRAIGAPGDDDSESYTANMARHEVDQATVEILQRAVKLALECGPGADHCRQVKITIDQMWKELMNKRQMVETVMTEAGWLKGDATRAFAASEVVMTASLRWDAADAAEKDALQHEEALRRYIIGMIGSCPDLELPWDAASDQCNLPASDQPLADLLRRDKGEYLRQMRERIAKEAGVGVDMVHVTVNCFGEIETP